MTTKYQRPLGAYSGGSALANRDKYQSDASAQPKVSISSSKMDGDLNYVIDALNEIDEAAGSKTSISDRLAMSLNADGSLKASASTVMDDWVNHEVINIIRMDNSTITCDGDQTSIYVANRRVKIIHAGVPLFATLESSTYSTGTTTLNLIDLVDENGDIAIINAAPTSIYYSPIIPGAIGNAVQKFADLSVDALNVKNDNAIVILTDTGTSGKVYGLRSSGGNFEVVENTGSEVSPIWVLCATVDANGYVIADEAITTNKLASNAITPAKLSRSGTLGQVLTSNGVSADPSYQDTVNIVWELISSATASASTSVDFTSGLTSDYARFMIVLDTIVPSAGLNIMVQLSTDGGATFKTSGYSAVGSMQSGSTVTSYDDNNQNSVVTTLQRPLTVTDVFHGTIQLSNLSDETQHKSIEFNTTACIGQNSVARYQASSSYYPSGADVSAINAVRVLTSTGNMVSGNLYLYGMKNS